MRRTSRILCCCLVWAAISAVLVAQQRDQQRDQQRPNRQDRPQQSTQVKVADLIGLLPSEEQGPRAADQLARQEAAVAVPALAKALSEDYPREVRWRAARALGAIGPPAKDAAGTLIAHLDDPNEKVRAYASYALGRIGGEEAKAAIPGLAERLTDESAVVRRAALDALLILRPDRDVLVPLMTKALEDSEPRIAIAAVRTLASQGEAVVPVLIEALQNEKAAYWATVALEEIGPKAKAAVPALIPILKAGEPEIRMQAAMTLGAIGEDAKSAAPQLIDRLTSDPAISVRYAAAYALGSMKAGGQAEQALRSELDSQDPLLAMISAWSLAKIRPDDRELGRQAAQMVVQGLQSEDPNVQTMAARTLVEADLADEQTTATLVATLDNASPAVAAQVVEALASLGPEAAPGVAKGLQNERLRKYVLRVLARMGRDAAEAVPSLVNLLESAENAELRREVQFTLGAIGPAAAPAVPELTESLSSKDDQVKYSAMYALGRIGEQARDAYNQLMNDIESEDAFLRMAAIWAMARIDPGQPEVADAATPFLAKMLSADRELLRIEAAATLAELGERAKSSLPALQKALDDPSPAVREAAQKAIARIEEGPTGEPTK